MKNKAPLALIELTVMILIFSVAAALCLQAFVWSDLASAEIGKQDRAMVQAETAAEVVKACGGDFAMAAELLCGECTDDGNGLTVYFDREWQVVEATAATASEEYRLEAVREDSGNALLGQAVIQVLTQDGEAMFCLPVCWQEVTEDGR